jgi:site-specific DNA recombinase
MKYLIYARVSPKGSGWSANETSIPDQILTCREYCRVRDPSASFEIIEDEFQSAASARRPGYRQILDALEANAATWDTLVIRHMDRLSRSLPDAVKILQLLQERGKGLISTTQNLDLSTPTGRAMLSIILVFAQWEREMCSERTKSKMHSIAHAGGWPPGLPPYGYRRKADKSNRLEPDPETGPKVAAIYRDYLANVPPGIIMRKYGIARSNLFRALHSPLYKGDLVYDGIVVREAHAALVPAETWNAVQQRLPADHTKPRVRQAIKEPFILAGLVRCEVCDKSMCGSTAHGRNGAYRYYQCEACHSRVPAKELETAVMDYLRDLPAVVVGQLLEELKARRDDERSKVTPQVKKIDAELSKLEKSSAGMEQAMTSGLITKDNAEEWNQQFADNRVRRHELTARRAALLALPDSPSSPYILAEAAIRELATVGKLLDQEQSSPESLRRIITTHITRIGRDASGTYSILLASGTSGSRYCSLWLATWNRDEPVTRKLFVA